MIQITLPDNSRREFPGPVSVAEVAQSIGPGLAKMTLAGKVDGRLVDALTLAGLMGTGYAVGQLHDRDGPVGQCVSSLLFEARG